MARWDSISDGVVRELAAPGLVTDDFERKEDQIRLKIVMDRLPARHRRVLVSHFVDELSVREIAHREGGPVGTVLSRIFTAKQLLRHVWANGTQSDMKLRQSELPQTEERRTAQTRKASGRDCAVSESRENSGWER